MYKKHVNAVTITIFLSILAGFLIPSVGHMIRPYVGYLLMAIMTVNLIGADFKKIRHISKKFLAFGTVIQYLFIPIIGWILIYFLIDNPDYAVGLILSLVMPVGVTTPALAKLLGGDFEESLLFVLIFSLIAIIATPYMMWLMAGIYIPIKPIDLLKPMILFIFVPFVIAKVIERMKYTRERCKRNVKSITLISLFLILWGIIGKHALDIIENFSEISYLVAIVFLLNVIIFTFVYLVSRFDKDFSDEVSLVLLSYKNYGLAIVLAATLFNEVVALAAVIFGIMQNVTIVIFFKFLDKYKGKLMRHI